MLLLYALKGPRRARVTEEFRLRFLVWPNDLDLNGHMNNGRYLTLLDLGRLDLLMRVGALRVALRNKWFPVLGACQVRFRRPLNLFQGFEIRTRLAGWDEKWVYIEQSMRRKGRVVMHAYLKGVFVGPGGSVPVTEVLARMGVSEASPPLPAAMMDWFAAERKMAEAGKDP